MRGPTGLDRAVSTAGGTGPMVVGVVIGGAMGGAMSIVFGVIVGAATDGTRGSRRTTGLGSGAGRAMGGWSSTRVDVSRSARGSNQVDTVRIDVIATMKRLSV